MSAVLGLALPPQHARAVHRQGIWPKSCCYRPGSVGIALTYIPCSFTLLFTQWFTLL